MQGGKREVEKYNLNGIVVYIAQPRTRVFVEHGSQFFKLTPVEDIKYATHKKRLVRCVRRENPITITDFLELLRIDDEFGYSVAWAKLESYRKEWLFKKGEINDGKLNE